MEDSLQKEIFTRLDALAAKLGVAAGEVWRILCKQAYVTGIQDVILALLFLAAAIALFKGAVYTTTEVRPIFDDWGRPTGQREQGFNGFTLALSVLCIVSSIMFIGYVNASVSEFMNPQYWALQKVASIFK